MIKKILKILIPNAYIKQIKNFLYLAREYGQFKTINQWQSVDSEGLELPWYTYPAIEYLDNLDFSQKSVFEFGSGNSSTFWSQRASYVVSVEHNKEWYEKVKENLKDNQKLIYADDNKDYENCISNEDKKFDVIIIDGIRRYQCTKSIKKKLNLDSEDGCMVILDNSDWHKKSAKYLREELDFIEVDFHGFGPINDYTWTTSIFVSRNFRFSPIDDIQPHFSKCAVFQDGDTND